MIFRGMGMELRKFHEVLDRVFIQQKKLVFQKIMKSCE